MLTHDQKRVLDFIENIPFKEEFLTPQQISLWMQSLREYNGVNDSSLNTGTKFKLPDNISLSQMVVENRNANRE
jgi:hypothetical protein